MSATAIVAATRLQKACRLLADTRMRVQDVGFAVGFDDPAYFARSFRRSIGVSPKQNRQHFDRSRPLQLAQAKG
jgi:AraC family transcriptional regulator, transcriptional activator of pobA